MKIINLYMQNFRNIAESSIELDGSTVIYGRNGAGKSTVFNALQMALCGHCEHTSRNGAGFAELIKEGAKDAAINVEFQHGDFHGQITMSLGKKKAWDVADAVTGELYEDITTPEILWYRLGIPFHHVLVTMFPGATVAGKEFSDILAERINGDVDPQELTRRIPGEHVEYIIERVAVHNLTLDSVTDFENLGGFAFDWRREVKRDLKHAEATLEDIGFVKPVKNPSGKELTPADIPRIRVQMEKLESERQEAWVAKGRADAAASAATVDVASTEAAIEDAGAKIWELDAEIEAEQPLFIEAEKAREIYAGAESAFSEANEKEGRATAQVREIEQAKPGTEKCPTCDRKLTKAALDKVHTDWAHSLDCAKDILAQTEKLRDDCSAKVDAARDAVNLAEDAANKHRVPSIIAEERHEAMEHINRLRAQLEAVPAPYEGPSVDEAIEQINEIEIRQARGKECILALSKLDEIEGLRKTISALESEAEHLDWIVQAYKDGVEIKALLAVAARPVVSACNAVLAALGDYEIGIHPVGKTLALSFCGRALARCSKGQRAMVAYAMAAAFADSGAPMLLDDANDLDAVHRSKLLGLLKSSSAETMVVAGTPLQSKPDIGAMSAALDPARVVWVDDGEYTTAKTEVAA